MRPALFLVVAVVLSVVGSLVAWLLLRDRSKTTDAMTDFQRRMSALDPSAANQPRDRKSKPGSRRSN